MFFNVSRTRITADGRHCVRMYLHAPPWNLWESLTGCCPGNPTMAGYELKLQKFQEFLSPECFLSCLVFSIYWNPKEVGSCSQEGTEMRTEWGPETNEPKPPPMCLYSLPAQGVAKSTGVSSYVMNRIKGVCLPTKFNHQRSVFASLRLRTNQSKMIHYRCALHFCL